MKRWHHGHSLGAGVFGGLLVSQHIWLVFVLGVCAGVVLAYLRQSAAWVADKLERWRMQGPSKRARIASEPTPVYRVPRERFPEGY